MMESKMPGLLNSPTSVASPVEDPEDPPPPSVTSVVARSANMSLHGSEMGRSKKEEGGAASAAGRGILPTEPGTTSPVEEVTVPTPRRSRAQEPCPEVITGSKLDKTVKLPPNIWVKIGRQPKAALCINDPGVSRDQCSLKWDTYQRRVELRIDTPGGNLVVNGAEPQDARSVLEHGDRLRVQGRKGYEFILDLRPVRLGFGDPKQAARSRASREDPEKRNLKLREQLHALEKQIKEQREVCLQEDKDFYEIEMRRRMREEQIQEKQRLLKFYIEDTERLKEELEEKRQSWLRRLEDEYKANQAEYEPLVEHVADLQDKLEKLQLKKDELARSIHPERYAVADVAVMEVPSPALTDQGSLRGAGARGGDESGEEDAFAGLSGLEDNREASEAEAEDAKPAVAVKSQPKAEAGDEPTKVVKREADAGEDAGEPAAKQPRLGGEGETWVCKERAAEGAEPSSGSEVVNLEGRVLD